MLILEDVSMDESAAVAASQDGDRDAFGVLVDRYYKNLYRYAYECTANHHDADDLCQETFVRAFDRIGTLKDGTRFRAWLFSIALNLIRRHWQRTSKAKKMTSDTTMLNTHDAGDDHQGGPFGRLHTTEQADIVHQTIANLPDHWRQPVVLIWLEGFNQKQAAGILGISEASISRHLEAAHCFLKTQLRELVA